MGQTRVRLSGLLVPLRRRLPLLWAKITLLAACSLGAQSNSAPPPDTAVAHQLFAAIVEQQAKVHTVAEVALSPDGKLIAVNAQASDGSFRISLSAATPDASGAHVTAGEDHSCYEGEPRWSSDGKSLAFLSDCSTPGQLQVFVASVNNGSASKPERLTDVTGPISHLHWSPDRSRLAFAYVPNAHRAPNPMAAEGRAVGVIDDLTNTDVQQIAIVDRSTRALSLATPSGLYAFEYDWSPDSRELVYVASAPPGDDNWYVASLYRQSLDSSEPTLLFRPKQQIALPRWSPDGRSIAFIQGLMSDQGGTGGDIYVVRADRAASPHRASPENLTPGRSASPSWLSWRRDNTLLFSEFAGGSVAVNTLDPHTRLTRRLWLLDSTVRATNEEASLSIAADAEPLTFATSRVGWSAPPEVWLSQGDTRTQLTHLNRAITLSLPRATSLTWNSDNLHVQGWLLYPKDYDDHKQYPLLVLVHGGPAWISTPTLEEPNFNATAFAQLGYFVLFPNPRGSYGQGEAFTRANRRDWGFGDLRDILRGVDAVTSRVHVDPHRIGLLGWSYGGSTAMFAGTQTTRFQALVAGAGAADWLSYYGQNSIDQWMRPYFGASPYDTPQPYRRSSAMTWIKHAQTPTLILVGERDGEAPAVQSLQFWHALRELHVPTQLVVYPDEGHAFSRKQDRLDVMVRTYAWLRRYIPLTPGRQAQ